MLKIPVFFASSWSLLTRFAVVISKYSFGVTPLCSFRNFYSKIVAVFIPK